MELLLKQVPGLGLQAFPHLGVGYEQEEQAAFDEAIAGFKAEMIDYFGADACAAFGITG